MSIQRYGLALETVHIEGRDMTVPGIEPRADGELGRFADFAAAIAAKDAELAKLREQRDRLLLKRYVENVNALQYGMSMVDAQRIVDAEIAEEFGVRIIDGKVEEIGNG